jgi:ABC-type glycerol-3-phosphate transport system substrate-binding protein
MDRWTRRNVLIGSAAGAPAVLLAACGGATQGGAGTDAAPKLSTAPVTITAQITDVNPAMTNSWANEMAAPYKAKRSNVTLELLPMPSSATLETFEKLTAAMAGGAPPDIFDGPRFADWTVARNFTDTTMDGLVKRDKFDTKVFSQTEFLGAHTTQGKIAHIPYKYGGNMVGMMINTSLFQEAGVALPPADVTKAWTAEQYLQALTKLTRSAGDGTISQFGGAWPGSNVYTWTLLWGVDFMSDDVKTVTCDSAAMIAGYQWMQDLAYRHHVVPQTGEAARLFPNTNVFMAGKQAIAWTAAANFGANMNLARDAGVKITVLPAPALKVSTPDVNSHGLFLVKGAKKSDDAWEVIKYFSEKSKLANFANALTTVLGDLEPVLKTHAAPHPAVDPKAVKQMIETAKRGINLKKHINQDEMLRVINPGMTELADGKVPAADLMRRIKPQIQAAADAK